MSLEVGSIQLFGRPFSVLWQSRDRRQFANRDRCYHLASFEGMDQHDLDALRSGLPASIEKCWLPNPDYKANASREDHQWHHATGRRYDRPGQHHPPTHAGFYYPPEARDLRFIDPKDPQVSASPSTRIKAAAALLAIRKELFHVPSSGPGAALLSRPGAPIFLATFSNGNVRFLKEVAESLLPSDAVAYFQSADLRVSVERVLTQSQVSQANLEATRAQLQMARETAARTLKKALEKWYRFDPPGMKANTKARIEKAVRLYLTDPVKHSLAEVAREFGVSRKTVSVWFKEFTQYTGFPVVTYKRHESVAAHLRGEAEEERQRGDAGEHCDDASAK